MKQTKGLNKGLLGLVLSAHALACIPSFAQGQRPQVNLPGDEILGPEMQRHKEMTKGVLEHVTPGVVDSMKASLPRLTDFANRLKRGDSLTVSAQGNAAIGRIRTLFGPNNPEKPAALKELKDMADQGVPEALNFLGIAYEMGLMGLSKNIPYALKHYDQAAKQAYIPAIYNIALIDAYARNGNPAQDRALSSLIRATEMAEEGSGRVCGMASFLAYRLDKPAQSRSLAKGCPSPLSGLAKASDTNEPIDQRIKGLRDVIAAGIDDGYPMLAKITKTTGYDPAHYFCKYALVDKYKTNRNYKNLRDEVQGCLDTTKSPQSKELSHLLRTQTVDAIAGFVPTEIEVLTSMRKNNKANHSWPVPFLPFRQDEMDDFTRFVNSERTP